MVWKIIFGVAVMVFLAWVVAGDPSKLLGNTFYPDGPAPWERVDVIYFAKPNDPVLIVSSKDAGSLKSCRTLISTKVPPDNYGRYKCGVGPRKDGDTYNYRLVL